MGEIKMGELLLKNKLATDSQIAEALQMKMKYPNKTLGQILCQMGFVSKADLDQILDQHNKRQKLGEILIKQNFIDERKLAYALSVSSDEKSLLGQTLLKLNYIEEEQLARCIASQYDLPFVSLRNLNLSPDLNALFNYSYAQRHKIVPISKVGKTVTFAMAFPLEKSQLRDIERAAKIIVNPVIATESDISRAQKIIYKEPARTRSGRDDGNIEIREDEPRERSKSKYTEDVINAETEQIVRKIISLGVKANASDIHLESDETGLSVRYRIDGMMQSLDQGDHAATVRRLARSIISRFKILCEMDIAEKRRSQDGSFRMRVMNNETVRVVDFRVATLQTQFGEDMVIRVLDKKGLPLSLSVLGLSQPIVDAIHAELDVPSGIFLVTGPTGSGKSATLHALLAKINKPGLKSMTVEDPIEYSMEGVRQAEVNEEIGNTFSQILRTFMRQDPDNIMIGEIRDADTAALAVRAALTGHTILSSLQTNDATSAVTRLLSMNIDPSFLASTLRCVLAQRLVRVLCSSCREPYTPSRQTLSKFTFTDVSAIRMYRGKGCPACSFTGFSGRRPIAELWIPSSEELLLIHQKSDNISLRSMVFGTGNRMSMIEDGLEQVRLGETTLEELLRVVPFSQIADLNNRTP